MAEVAAVLNFSLTEIDEMDLDEIKKWHAEAAAIVRARRGGR